MRMHAMAQLAVGCYLVRVVWDLKGSPSQTQAEWKRHLWAMGCVALWSHIFLAFHFVHHWSHAEAVQHTAEQTRQLTGWAWGGGVYFNYAFALYWLIDVLRWEFARATDYPQTRAGFWIMHAVFGFMMFNATVVFGPPYWRIVGLIFAVIGFLVWFRSRPRK